MSALTKWAECERRLREQIAQLEADLAFEVAEKLKECERAEHYRKEWQALKERKP